MAPATAKTADDRDLLLRIVEEGHRKGNWNGITLRDALADVSAREATWKPAGAKNSIAAIALHCAYWKNAIRHSLDGPRKRSFPLPGKNWFELATTLTDEQWAGYLELLDAEHAELVKAIKNSQRKLAYDNDGGRSLSRKLFGVAMHDAYHTGQIRLLRAMYRAKGKA